MAWPTRNSDFTRSHLSKSVPGLLVQCATRPDVFKIVEFEDSLDIEHPKLHYKTALTLDINENFRLRYGSAMFIKGSANGLLLFGNTSARFGDQDRCVCNPVTRECNKLPEPEGIHPKSEACGFGVSRSSNQYKVVRIFYNYILDSHTSMLRRRVSEFVLHVYTLGTGSWRYITTPSEMLDYSCCSTGKLFNGNLHWLARDSMGSFWISCFDLETEVFTKFRAPKVYCELVYLTIGVLGNHLCLSDNSSRSEVTIYLLKYYEGEDKSWSKEYVLRKIPGVTRGLSGTADAVKAFADGDMLMLSQGLPFFCHHSNRSKKFSVVDGVLNVVDYDGESVYVGSSVEARLYTPSFVSLKDFETENAKLFEFECLMS